MTFPQYEDQDDRDLIPPLPPMTRGARVARKLNQAFPRMYALLSMAPRLAASYRWIRKLEHEGAGQPLSGLNFDDVRTSETVFVLGTGSSINTYSDEYWEAVRREDSIGMNFFILHDHVPTIHVMEDVHGIRSTLLSIRYLQRGDYRDTPLILKTQLSNLSSSRVRQRIDELKELPAPIRSMTFLSLDLLAAGKTAPDMEASYRTLAKLGLWRPKSRFQVLTKRRGSVSYVINLAVRAGYRRIVLCGVDLNHTEYFYDSRREEFAQKGMPVPINDEVGQVHSTNDPEVNPVTVQQVIMAIKENILDPMGVALMVGSETSALHPEVPVYEWPTSERPSLQPPSPSGQKMDAG